MYLVPKNLPAFCAFFYWLIRSYSNQILVQKETVYTASFLIVWVNSLKLTETKEQ